MHCTQEAIYICCKALDFRFTMTVTQCKWSGSEIQKDYQKMLKTTDYSTASSISSNKLLPCVIKT